VSKAGNALEFAVHAGPHTRTNCAVCVDVPEGGPDVSGGAGLVDAATHRAVSCQADPSVPGRVWFVVRELERGASARFVLRPSHPGGGRGVELAEGAEAVGVSIGGKAFTSYHYAGADLARPFLYPILGPGGARVTREARWDDGPGFDHKHHKSVWVAHGLVNGTDNWAETPGHGTTVHIEFSEVLSGPVLGRIVERNEWRNAAGQRILDEGRTIRFYNQPAEGRCVDLEITFVTGHDAVLFGDTKEGGLLSVRVNPTMNAPAGTITNSFSGTNEDETWGKPAQWCDYSGKADGKLVGIAAFDHPDNPLYPTRWHVRNYGLMTANPFGLSYFEPGSGKRGDWLLHANSQATFRYRLFVHKGSAESACVADRYHDYVHPPRVEFA